MREWEEEGGERGEDDRATMIITPGFFLPLPALVQ